jgi:hypothetical protein
LYSFRLKELNIGAVIFPHYFMRQALSTEEVDDRLKGIGTIKRIGEYVNIRTAVEFHCLICEYEWKTIPTRIWRGIGCPKCSDHLPLSNEIIDQRLAGRPIQRVGDYLGYHKYLKFRCLNDGCECEWNSKPANVIHCQSGCPICKNRLKCEKVIYNELKINNVNFEYHKKIKDVSFVDCAYSVDFWLPDCNTIIEYNGVQHYEPTRFGGISTERSLENLTKQLARDQFIQSWCNELKIKLIWIDGREYKIDKLKPLVAEIISSVLESK